MTELSTALADLNRRRLRVLAPLMVVLHAAHAVFFHVPAAARSALSPDTLRWRDDIFAAHVLTLPFALAASIVAWRARSAVIIRWLAPSAALVYVIHGAACASIDQLVSTNTSAYIGYCIGIAVILSLPPRASVPIYVVAFVAMLAGLTAMQASVVARMTNVPTSATVTLVSIAVSWILNASRRRDLEQRATIDRQRDELATLNHSLEERVRAQVHEIVARADEVERLNAQLHAQVRTRSTELSVALARLATQREREEILEPGVILADRFTVAEPLGKGGMGSVYAGVDRTTGQRVAIKVIQASSSDQLDAMRRFIREAEAAATVRHPAIVRMLHVDVTDDGRLFQIQELVDGATLAAAMSAPWPAPAAARLGAVLCDALSAAHVLGVVHRDVKPDNIMLIQAEPGLKLLDFGIAKIRDAEVREGEATHARMIIGTPGYMAPEQAAAQRDVSDRADVYAVGILLARMIGGPFRAPLPEIQMDGAPPAFADDVRRCLADEPSQRPAAADLARRLSDFADHNGAGTLSTIVPALARTTGDMPSQTAIPTTPQRRV